MRQILLLLSALFISCSTIQPARVSSRTTIARGVDVIEANYTVTKEGESLPTKLFIMDVRLSDRVTVLATAVEDDNASIKATKEEQTAIAPISKQLEAMQANRQNINVLGGVNADFYLIKRSNMIKGAMYRGSECLKGDIDEGENLFLVLKDGSAHCMTAEEYLALDKSLIAEAVSGRQMLLNDGVTQSNDTHLEPRTAVGVTKSGKRLFILVGDGRRKEYSNGLSYADMAQIFKSLGAYDALNLDGGGSSSFCLSVGDGKFAPINRPSDRAGERFVPNGIAVVELQ
ncbi:MAG: phosphodiester glycosidase family protein [Alistipes sp.]|nr:phosphodiester glycosidase family protein [Alistipes sp.]MBQ4503509.1 phosphodiester glycosidase family protein [Alistipes sp.]